MHGDKVNILLVDDQPAKLLSYEVILRDLGENLVKTASATEALQYLLKNDVAVVLVDVCMPDLDGFELAAMIREHPRFQRTAIIFISAIHLTDTDHLRGYEMGAVDYVPVPVVPEVLRAKVRVFAELYRKTRQLEKLNQELEQRVADRTAALEASTSSLLESERRRSVALLAGQMGSWDCDLITDECTWDAGQYRIFGTQSDGYTPTFSSMRRFIHPEDLERLDRSIAQGNDQPAFQIEFRITRPNGEVRWCLCAASITADGAGRATRLSGVTIDITDRKQTEEHQLLLAREVDHRARNALAVVQAIVRLTRAPTSQAYAAAVEGRIRALAQAHTLLSQSRWQGADVVRLVDEELAPYRQSGQQRIKTAGPSVFLAPDKAQILAVAVHELATNSTKYGALSSSSGELTVAWELAAGHLELRWLESGGPRVEPPNVQGFGTRIMNASIKHQIGGNVVFDWRPTGLHCMLSIPCGSAAAEDSQSATIVSNLVPLSGGNGRRVLLVEDETLVGVMMRDLLTELGISVVGPLCSVAETVSVLSAQEFDCAILDLNLGGNPVYPLADLLTERAIPFFFVTGYGSESIDPRFAAIPVLQKPIAREALEDIVRSTMGLPSYAPIADSHSGDPAKHAKTA